MLLGVWDRLVARLVQSQAFTRGSPTMPRLRRVMHLSNKIRISTAGTPRERATRSTCRAALGELNPDPDRRPRL
jgi:hypothetical protein